MGTEMTRRRLLTASAAGLGAPALAATSARGANRQASSEWAMFASDAANTGQSPNAAAPVGEVTEQWHVGLPNLASPAVVDDALYVGGPDGLTALSADDGSTLWQFESRNVQSPPAVVDGTVYAGSMDSTLYAVDAEDGSERWRFETDRDVFSSPAVVDGTVFAGSSGRTLYALDATGGSEHWRFEAGDAFRAPTVVDGTVYAGSIDETVYALDASDGSERWRFRTGESVVTAPAVVDETVYVGGWEGTLYALDARDGSEQWRFETNNRVLSSPTVVDGTVIFGNDDQTVYALDTVDGSERWTRTFHQSMTVSPAVVNGVVYVGLRKLNGGTNSPHVHALEAADGTSIWRFTVGVYGVTTSPVVGDGSVYVGDVSGLWAVTSDEVRRPTAGGDRATAERPTADDEPTTRSPTQSPAVGLESWVTNWWRPVAWLGTVSVLGPLVLGLLVALTDRLHTEPDDTDSSDDQS